LQKQGEPAIYEDFLNGSKTKSDNEFLIFFHHFEFEKFKPKVLKYSLKNKKLFLNQYTNEKIENYFSYFSNLKNPNLKKQEKFQFLKDLHNKIQIDELNEDEIEKTRSMSFEIIKKIFEILKTPIFNLHAKFREKIIDELNLDGFAKNFYEEEEKKFYSYFNWIFHLNSNDFLNKLKNELLGGNRDGTISSEILKISIAIFIGCKTMNKESANKNPIITVKPSSFCGMSPEIKIFSAPILFIAFNSTNLDELIEKLHFLEKEEISYLFSTSKFQSASLEKSLFLQFLSHGVYNKMNVIQIGYNGLNYRIISNKAEKSFATKNRFNKDGDEKLDGIILKILENVTLFNWNFEIHLKANTELKNNIKTKFPLPKKK